MSGSETSPLPLPLNFEILKNSFDFNQAREDSEYTTQT